MLCFNYTEFVESLYGVKPENVCYIHGCRRKKKGFPKEKLILGHMPGASDEAFDRFDSWNKGKGYKNAMIAVAQENVIDLISEYDKDLTKNCDEIIADHDDFISSLIDVEEIVVIGHSFSNVDWPYFRKICEKK